MRTLQDRVAVITGAGSGIGRELALELARRGATIAAVDVRPEGIEETARLVRAIGPSVSTHVADVADAERMQALPGEVLEAHGACHILINNAGGHLSRRVREGNPRGPALDRQHQRMGRPPRLPRIPAAAPATG